MADDDPFGAFGDSGDSDVNEDDSAAENLALARALVESANTQSPSRNPKVASDDSEELWNGTPLVLPWKEPLFLGPIVLVDDLPYGGGRGYVATKTIAPGTLVLIEERVVSWPAEQLGQQLNLVSVRKLFTHPRARELYRQLEHYHPTKVDVDSVPVEAEQVKMQQVHTMIDHLRSEMEKQRDETSDIIELAKSRSVTNSNETPVSTTDIIRLLLGLRYNGLESGLYLHVAMLNHSDQPNCVKFLPTANNPLSEVRTTKRITAGTPLTISYVPNVISHASRRFHLWEQHRFDIGSSPAAVLQEFELVAGKTPPSSIISVDTKSPTHRIEVALAELEEMHLETKRKMTSNAESQIQDVAKALEQSSLELCVRAVEQLQNDKHILLIPCYKLHIDCCELVQADPSLPASQRIDLTGRLLRSGLRLSEMQELVLGVDHFDMARTNLDIAHATEELLATSIKHLLDMGIGGLDSSSSCSMAARRARSEYQRVKALYPHDAQALLGRRQTPTRGSP